MNAASFSHVPMSVGDGQVSVVFICKRNYVLKPPYMEDVPNVPICSINGSYIALTPVSCSKQNKKHITDVKPRCLLAELSWNCPGVHPLGELICL